MTHMPKSAPKIGTRKPVPVSGVSDMQFGYQIFLVPIFGNECSISVPVYGSGFLVRVFGANF